jgi:hypothetical protein
MNRISHRLLSATQAALAASALLAAGSAWAASEPASPPTPAPAPTQAAAPVLTGPEASIPFANHGGIYDFHADNDRGIWIQSRSRQWYYGQFFAPCFGIQFAQALGFRAGPTGALDKWSEVVSRDVGRCVLTSLRSSEPPPGYARKGAVQKEADKK